MRMLLNGQEIDVPTNADGSVSSEIIRGAGGLDSNRVLLQRKPDGGNYVVNPQDRVYVGPQDHFDSAPAHKRG